MSRADAVWAAVYVRVLSALDPREPQQTIIDIADMIEDATKEREDLAIKAADAAVARLRARGVVE